MTNAIEIRQLEKTYISKKSPPKQALKGINLDIPSGSFFGLLGMNGAGKSTIINIIAGLVRKTGGSVKVMGHDTETNTRQAKLSVGVVPQELVLDPFFTVYEALENHAGYYGMRKKDRKTDEIIEAMGLKDKAFAKPRSLSGGMRRRLLIGKALVHSPKVLILDEPTAGVDVELREQLWHYVKELNAKGTTIILTTHYLEEAETLCDKIAIIHNGEIVANDNKSSLMSILDRKQLVISFNEPAGFIPEFPESVKAEMKDGKLYLEYSAKMVMMEDILKPIFGNNLHIKDISTREPALDDIFRYFTKD